MGHRITIDEARLNANYEKMMDEVYLLYHTHPTCLTPINPSDAELAEASEYNSLGRGLASAGRGGGQHFGGHGSKSVFYQQTDTCNGLPRHK